MRAVHLLIALISLLVAAEAAQLTEVVQTKDGPVQGVVVDGVRKYLGIPFAAPPVGANRWRPPQPVTPWTETLNATKVSAICPQIHLAGPIVEGNEDCLYIDVIVPGSHDAENDEPLPVMVWIYGGGFVEGSEYNSGRYDARNSSLERDVIIVAMNYRLGVFGFLAHPYLQAEDADNSTGNYGIQDQRQALRWVQANIAQLGGNPDKVTIFGESAGAFSVCTHLAAPASAGLFHAAIMESATCSSNAFFQPLKSAFGFADVFTKAVAGCDAETMDAEKWLSCMRAKKTPDCMNAIATWGQVSWPIKGGKTVTSGIPPMAPVMPWGPVVDGSASAGLPQRPLDAFVSGTFNKVPVIMGTNKDEGTIFIKALPYVARGAHNPPNATDVEIVMKHFYNDTTAAAILSKYPVEQYRNSQFWRCSAILTDSFFKCESHRVANAFAKHNVPMWIYRFQYVMDWDRYATQGDYHSAELPFVWGNPPTGFQMSTRDAEMSKVFNEYWGNFAHNQNPNNATGAPTWPQWTLDQQAERIMAVPPKAGSGTSESICSFWANIEHKPWP